VSDVVRGEWNREWFDELASAPFSAHDDQADSAAGAFTELALGKHGGGAMRLASATAGQGGRRTLLPGSMKRSKYSAGRFDSTSMMSGVFATCWLR